MITRAFERFIKISPKKLRLVVPLVKEKTVDEALATLFHTNKKGAALLKGVIESALHNAKRIPEKDFYEEELYISRVAVDQGPALRRFRAMSLGRAGTIRKRTSHILIELDAPRRTPDEMQKKAKSRASRKAKTAAAGKA
jgi:large subunit ribosomal protein L22